MKNIIACIDGSAMSASVCDAAAWASNKLEAPLSLLHVLEKTVSPENENLSGSIGLGAREALLEQLTELDEKRSRIALEHGKHMLDDARQRAVEQGADDVFMQQRHGSLLESLTELESDMRLLVLGRLGEDHDVSAHTIGSQLESVIRAMHVPILVAVGEFKAPRNYMIAYDGSDTANKAIERVAASPLLKGLEGHIVMVGDDSEKNNQALNQATDILQMHGHNVQSALVQGEVIEGLKAYRHKAGIEMMIMGAYGHSRVRQFFLGSNTQTMISNSNIPLILLR
ncbi:MAG: universal stress protein [Kangiella sp.]|jgi:nucleotide-binding universal stress UspA family protein|nr:universal stress protein [Kangiella sp.]